MTDDNMKLWNAVCKTNPANTKNSNVRGNQITSVAPQTQIMAATEQWGVYGVAWGWKSFEYDYTLVSETGILVFKGVFFFPNGEFPIGSSISVYRDNARTKPDQDFAKKVETDALTKGLSKLGFNADIFMGCFDDVKYVEERKEEVRKESGGINKEEIQQGLKDLVIEMNKLTAKDNLQFLDGLIKDSKAMLEQAEELMPKTFKRVMELRDAAAIRIGSFPGDDDPFGLPEATGDTP